MKTTIACICFLVCCFCGCATHQSLVFDCQPFDNSVLDVVIPHIKVENATIEEAIQEVERQWQKQLGNKTPPERISLRHAWPNRKYLDTPERTERIRLVSFEKQNISVEDCLHLISQLAPLEGFRIKRGKLIITYFMGHHEDWYSALLPVTSKGKRFLGLSKDTTAEELTDLLKNYGIKFQGGPIMSASWHPQIEKIIITTLPNEIDKLRALLSLVEEGYEIKKMPNKEPDATR